MIYRIMKKKAKFEKMRVNQPFNALYYRCRNDFDIERNHAGPKLCEKEKGIKSKYECLLREVMLKEKSFYIDSQMPIDGGYE